MKMTENQSFSEFFREYKNGALPSNWLIKSYQKIKKHFLMEQEQNVYE